MSEADASQLSDADEGGTSYGVSRIGPIFVGIPIECLSEVCQVGTFQQMLIKSPYLSGGIDLRGHMIPVINLTRICGFDDPPERPKFAVILRRNDELMAFLVDEVVGITRINRNALQSLHHIGRDPLCVTGVFQDRNRLISVADVNAIFDLPGIFSVTVPRAPQSLAEDVDRSSILLSLPPRLR